MPKLIDSPTRLEAAGTPPKTIDEYVGTPASVQSRWLATVCVAALFAVVAPASVQAQALPSGHTGIAARYALDDGIADDADVLFADDFEAIDGDRLDFNMGWDNVYGALRVTADAHGGTQAIEITHDGPEQSQGAWRDFGASGVETMFLRYYLKYHPDYPGCHHTGGGILAAAPGTDLASSTGMVPNGTNHYTAFIDEIAPFFNWSPPGNSAPGFMYIYCYHMDQGSNYGDVFMPDGSISPNQRTFTGDPDFTARPNVILERDRWYHFEIMVQANTPGQSDGRIAFWIDGEVAGDFPNLQLRSDPSLVPNVAIISSYTSDYFPNQSFVFDDVVVATSYVGPVAGDVVQPGGDMGEVGDMGDETPAADMGGTPPDDANNTSPPPTNNTSGLDAGRTNSGPPSSAVDEADGCCRTVRGHRPTSALLAVLALFAILGRRRRI